jgi:dihydroflavonol-4-reductase
MNPVLVTGASGMLGAGLCRHLVEDGEEVVALVRRPLTHPLLSGLAIRQMIGDLLDRESLRKAMEGCDGVYHAAGAISYRDADRGHLYRTNLEGTLNVLRAAADSSIRRVVFTSSTAAVGIPDDDQAPLHEGSAFHPRYERVPYMASKRAAEEAALQQSDVEVVAVNPATIYGEGDVYFNTGALFRQIARKKLGWIPPGGTSVVSLQDCVDGHLLAMEKGTPGQRYILSSHHPSYRELMGSMAKALGVEAPSRTMPRSLEPFAWFAGALHDHCVPASLQHRSFSRHVVTIGFRKRFFDSTRARKDWGGLPRNHSTT